MRDPFAFLQTESRERLLLLLLQSMVKKQGGEVILSLTDLTSIDDGSALMRKTSDDGQSIVLSFARKGAEAYFLSESAPSQPATSRGRNSTPPETPPPQRRSATHSDLDLALLEEERMAERSERQRRSDIEARRQSGELPWTTRQPS